MSRPFDEKYKIGFGYKEAYPPTIQKLLKIKYHKGYDYFTPIGTKLFNPVYGTITEIGERKYMGKYIKIRFEVLQGLAKSIYRFVAMHLSEIKINTISSKTIAKGELLALSGDTGTFYDGRYHQHCHCQIDKWDRDKEIWVDVDPAFIFGSK
jgi:murein DD-endopeptidase MepM/ murein hydrolase activator NlpD